MRTLILSDLHLGSPNCQAEHVLELLQGSHFDRLILNGDTINNLNLKKLKPRHWAVVDCLRSIARSRDLVLVRGNHDHDYVGPNPKGFGPHCVLPALLGVPMVEDYRLEVGLKPYLVLHGDRFDPTLNYPLVTDVADQCYQLTQKLNKKLAKWLKKKSKRWAGVLAWVRDRSIHHARQEGFEGIFTGHTHFADDVRVDDFHYVNSGCWTDATCSYVNVEGDRVRLRQYFD